MTDLIFALQEGIDIEDKIGGAVLGALYDLLDACVKVVVVGPESCRPQAEDIQLPRVDVAVVILPGTVSGRVIPVISSRDRSGVWERA